MWIVAGTLHIHTFLNEREELGNQEQGLLWGCENSWQKHVFEWLFARYMSHWLCALGLSWDHVSACVKDLLICHAFCYSKLTVLTLWPVTSTAHFLKVTSSLPARMLCPSFRRWHSCNSWARQSSAVDWMLTLGRYGSYWSNLWSVEDH